MKVTLDQSPAAGDLGSIYGLGKSYKTFFPPNMTNRDSEYIRVQGDFLKTEWRFENDSIISGRNDYIIAIVYTVKLRWLEPLWDHENLFDIWVVRAIEG